MKVRTQFERKEGKRKKIRQSIMIPDRLVSPADESSVEGVCIVITMTAKSGHSHHLFLK